MKTFKMEPRFNPRTGEPMEPEPQESGVVCDYSGERLDLSDDIQAPENLYAAEDDTGSEESWYYDDFKIDGKRVNLHALNNTQDRFAYAPATKGMATEPLIALEWMADNPNASQQLKEGAKAIRKMMGFDDEPIFEEAMTFADAMHAARYRAIKKAIQNGITPQELGIEFADE